MSSAKEKADTHKTARDALDRATLDALVTLFLVRDGNVLPDELKGDKPRDCERQLVLYAELSGLLNDGAAELAHRRVEDAED